MPGCSLCEVSEARVLVQTSCCSSTACRLCAVSYLARAKRCWAVDCGCPTSIQDLELPEPEGLEGGAPGREALPQLSQRLLTCELCGGLCKRAVTSPCCWAARVSITFEISSVRRMWEKPQYCLLVNRKAHRWLVPRC